MYEKSDKRRLYWLIDQYLSSRIDERTFCDEFYYSYDLEINNETLTGLEQQTFAALSKVASRFSQYEADHQLDAKAFSTVQELQQKIIETKEKLRGQSQI